MPADLHCHSTASDGSFSPTELVRLAKKLGLDALGITDHDTLNGVEEAQAAGRELGIEIVPGVELNTDFGGKELHILGYYPDLDSPQLQDMLSRLREMRSSRAKKMLEKLSELGKPVSEQLVNKIAGDGAVGRPHVAQALQELGYVNSIKEAFESFIGQGKPAYVSRFKLTPEQGIKVLKDAGAVPVLAHPGLLGMDEMIDRLVQSGLQGLEVYHTSHDREMEEKYEKIARQFGLIITGGSDFHGPERKLDIQMADRVVPMKVVAELKSLKREKEKEL